MRPLPPPLESHAFMASLSWKRLRCIADTGGLPARELAHRVYRRMGEHELMTRAAAISYYALSALVPFLGVVLTVLATLLPRVYFIGGSEDGATSTAITEFSGMTGDFLPQQASELIASQVARIQEQPPVGLISVGLVLSLWLASGVFKTIIDALNRVHGVKESRSFVILSLEALLMTLVEAAILLAALISLAIWPQLVGWLGLSQAESVLATGAHWVVVVASVMLSFALAFYFGPNADQRWEWITPGSLLGTAGWLLASWGFRAYVQQFGNYDKTYGALGGVVVLLAWIWLSALILLVAAEINAIISDACRCRASDPRPDRHGWGARRPVDARPAGT